MSDFVLGKETNNAKVLWMGGDTFDTEVSLGEVIENECRALLPVNPDPFSDTVNSAGQVSLFHIDSIAVERVSLVTLDVTTSYYMFRVDEDTVYRLACFWFTLVNTKVWYPLMPMDPVDIYHISDMLLEYERGKHEMWCKMNDALVELIERFEKEQNENN